MQRAVGCFERMTSYPMKAPKRGARGEGGGLYAFYGWCLVPGAWCLFVLFNSSSVLTSTWDAEAHRGCQGRFFDVATLRGRRASPVDSRRASPGCPSTVSRERPADANGECCRCGRCGPPAHHGILTALPMTGRPCLPCPASGTERLARAIVSSQSSGWASVAIVAAALGVTHHMFGGSSAARPSAKAKTRERSCRVPWGKRSGTP